MRAVGALVADAAVDHLLEDAAIDQAGRLGQPAAGDQAAEKARSLEQQRPRALPRRPNGGDDSGGTGPDHYDIIRSE